MSVSGIHGHLLEITVAGCTKLKDTEWFSRQDPYVCLEYGTTKFRTRTCKDGGKNPTFQEKFLFTLIEGLRELNVVVWNSNTLTYDDFIGNGKIQLSKVLSTGYDDTPWSIQTKNGRYAGEVRLIMHYAQANQPTTNYGPSAPPYAMQPAPQVSMYYSAPPMASAGSYPVHGTVYPTLSPHSSYQLDSGAYPPYEYPRPSAYHSQSYAPPSVYHPPRHHPPQGLPYYPPGPFPGIYR